MTRQSLFLLAIVLIVSIAARADADSTPMIVLSGQSFPTEPAAVASKTRPWVSLQDNPQIALAVAYRAVVKGFYDASEPLRRNTRLEITDVQPRRTPSKVIYQVSASIIHDERLYDSLMRTEMPARFVIGVEDGSLHTTIARVDEAAAREQASGTAMAAAGAASAVAHPIRQAENDIVYAVNAGSKFCIVAMSKHPDDVEGWSANRVSCKATPSRRTSAGAIAPKNL